MTNAGPPAEGLPSDTVAAITGHGETDVSIAIVSMSARSPDGQDAGYLEWHALDHLPEQYRIAQLRAGIRWVSTEACRAARAADDERYRAVDHVVMYLFAEPVEEALETFFGLGADLAAAGRIPRRLPSVELAGWRLGHKAAAARVGAGADVIPWRPAQGVYLIVERDRTPADVLVGVPGVAGCWQFAGSADLSSRLADTAGLTLTVCFLDDDPITVAANLDSVIGATAGSPLWAAPLMALVPWEWTRSLPAH